MTFLDRKLPVQLNAGERTILVGKPGGPWFWLWVVTPLFFLINRSGFLVFGSQFEMGGPSTLAWLLLVAAFALLRSGRFWLTNQRLIWKPVLGEVQARSIASIEASKLQVKLLTNSMLIPVGVNGEPEIKLLHQSGLHDLWGGLHLFKAIAPAEVGGAQYTVSDIAIWQSTVTDGQTSRPGLSILRPTFCAFIPTGQNATVIAESLKATSVPPVVATYLGENKYALELLIEAMRVRSDPEFDRFVWGLAIKNGGKIWCGDQATATLQDLRTHQLAANFTSRAQQTAGDISPGVVEKARELIVVWRQSTATRLAPKIQQAKSLVSSTDGASSAQPIAASNRPQREHAAKSFEAWLALPQYARIGIRGIACLFGLILLDTTISYFWLHQPVVNLQGRSTSVPQMVPGSNSSRLGNGSATDPQPVANGTIGPNDLRLHDKMSGVAIPGKKYIAGILYRFSGDWKPVPQPGQPGFPLTVSTIDVCSFRAILQDPTGHWPDPGPRWRRIGEGYLPGVETSMQFGQSKPGPDGLVEVKVICGNTVVVKVKVVPYKD